MKVELSANEIAFLEQLVRDFRLEDLLICTR